MRRHSDFPTGFGSLWFTVTLDLIGFGIVIPILPVYAERFDASPASIGLLLASFSLAQFMAATLWGRLSDRVGRKPVLIISLLGTCLGSLLTALAPSLSFLFLARVLDGASGGSVAVAQAAVADIAEPTQRPRLLGLLGAAYGIGFVAGPALGGIAAFAGDRAPFYLAASLAAANLLVAARRLRETGGRTAAASRPHSRRAESPRAAFTPELIRLLAIAFLATAAFGGFEATFALLAARRLGLSVAAISGLFVVAGLAISIVNVRGFAPLTRRLGDVGALRAALVTEATGLAILSTADTLMTIALAVCVLAIGHGLTTPALAAAITTRAAPHQRGEAFGAQQSAASVARIAGPLAAASLLGLAGPGIAAASAAALGALAIYLTRPLPTAPPAATSRPQLTEARF